MKTDLTITINPRYVECQNSWDPKCYGVIFVNEESHITPLFEALVEQDDYWENHKHLIQVAPKTINHITDLDGYTEYCGKTDIYNISALKEKLDFDFIIYQTYEP